MSRAPWTLVALGAVAALVAPSLAHRPPAFIWNASASVPEGLYRLRPAGALRVGELVAATPPEPLASFLAARRYLPRGALLLKPIAALPGQTVCRRGARISVDGARAGETLPRDRRGRPLPTWSGCRVVARGEVFLMNPTVRDSFDGRYFGALPATALVGRAAPVWLWPRPAASRRRAASPQSSVLAFPSGASSP